jgi:hypothetical protein
MCLAETTKMVVIVVLADFNSFSTNAQYFHDTKFGSNLNIAIFLIPFIYSKVL